MQKAAESKQVTGRGDATGKWLPVKSKRHRGKRVFYYNYVSRKSTWKQPPDLDWELTRSYVPKAQQVRGKDYGFGFYHV